MRKICSAFRPSAVALAVALASCTSTTASTGTGHLSLILKDAPGDVLAAVVTISEINLQADSVTTILSSTPVTTDLLTLAADADTLLEGVVVPAGRYSQLRFVLSGAYIEVDNGDGTSSVYASSPNYAGLPPGTTVAGALQMPSMGQSGLKVTLSGNGLTIPDGGSTVLVADFDVAESFGHPAAGSSQWVMHPVIRGADISLTGSATVDVALDPAVTLPQVNGTQLTLADFSVTFTGSDGVPRPAPLADADGDGSYSAELLHVAPGDYTIDITPPTGVTTIVTLPVLPQTITFGAGGAQTLSVTIIGVS